MTIRILHAAGVGPWPQGATIEIDDRRALRLIRDGYAEPTPMPVPAKRRKD